MELWTNMFIALFCFSFSIKNENFCAEKQRIIMCKAFSAWTRVIKTNGGLNEKNKKRIN